MKIKVTIHKPKSAGVTPGLNWPCLAKGCETEAAAMPELTIGATTWMVWACDVHAGNLEDSLFEMMAE